MAAPGSLAARYERLAGHREDELYVARSRLGFSIDEWLALPWWQRRVYINGLRREAEEAQNPGQGERTEASGIDAILYGTMADVAATTPFSTT